MYTESSWNYLGEKALPTNYKKWLLKKPEENKQNKQYQNLKKVHVSYKKNCILHRLDLQFVHPYGPEVLALLVNDLCNRFLFFRSSFSLCSRVVSLNPGFKRLGIVIYSYSVI